ncbi:M48 family metalloprotease [Halococcus sediminicola]|uniref:M48 family metalloprotease n=1 Tax=Halococcus sediminicola TaxID=1264579 RepID=UPI000679CB73|nr:M48 family metalloprotease [Halococcus sediminicola]
MRALVIAGLIEVLIVIAAAATLYVGGRWLARAIMNCDLTVSKRRERLSALFVVEMIIGVMCMLLVLIVDILLGNTALGTGSFGVTLPVLLARLGNSLVLILTSILPLVLYTSAIYLAVTPSFARIQGLEPLPLHQRVARNGLQITILLTVLAVSFGAWKAATTSIATLGLAAAVLWVIGIVAGTQYPPVAAWFRRHSRADTTMTERLGAKADDIHVYLRPDPTGEDITGLATGAAGRQTITLSDSAVETLDDDELSALITHERAHHAHHDSLIGTVFCMTLFAGVFATGSVLWVYLGWGAWPTVGIVVAGVLTGWLVYLKAFSRPAEYKADRYRLNADKNIEGRRKLLRRYDADRNESWIARLMPRVEYATSTHPTPEERLTALETAIDSESER